MQMDMMRIRDMRMRVTQGFVLMRMAVRPFGHFDMHVVVVSVVMPVGMLMRHGFMAVAVRMGFHQVQHHAGQHEQAAQAHQKAG